MTGAPVTGPPPGAVTTGPGSGDLSELAGRHVEDEPAHVLGVRYERADLDPADRLPHVLVQVGEGLGAPLWLDPGVVLDGPLELVVGEGQHPAVGVVDQHDLAGAEQALADGQRADLVVGDDPAGVADHVSFAVVQAEQPIDIEPGVHAGDDGDVLRRRHRQRAGEAFRVTRVVGQVLIDDGHGAPSPARTRYRGTWPMVSQKGRTRLGPPLRHDHNSLPARLIYFPDRISRIYTYSYSGAANRFLAATDPGLAARPPVGDTISDVAIHRR